MTVTLKLGEQIIGEVIAKLKAGYSARAAVINQEKNDGIVITAPRSSGGPSWDGSDYYRGGIEQLADTPAVMVAEGPMEPDADTEGPHSMVTVTQFLVRVVDADASREQLGLRLQRHVRAIVETLWDDPPMERLTTAHRIVLVRTEPGPVFDPDQQDRWRSYYDIVFAAEQFEGA